MRSSCYYRIISIAPKAGEGEVVDFGIVVVTERGIAARFIDKDKLQERVSCEFDLRLDHDTIQTWETELQHKIRRHHTKRRIPLVQRLHSNRDIFSKLSNPHSSIQFGPPIACTPTSKNPQGVANQLFDQKLQLW